MVNNKFLNIIMYISKKNSYYIILEQCIFGEEK